MVSCCLNVDILVSLTDNRTITENMDACLKVSIHRHSHRLIIFYKLQWNSSQVTLLFQEGLKAWAHQIKDGVCLIDGKKLPEETELTTGQVV